MSDLYDSLEEDEIDEKKNLAESLDVCETAREEFSKKACEGESTDNYSFYLNRNVTEEKANLFPNFECNNNQKKKILPEIERDIHNKGLESFGNTLVDNRILGKQGLHLNDDGSFTKSPRSNVEELPFITREYRNLQFQKKKTYKIKKRNSFDKDPSKKNFNSTEEPLNAISKNKIIKAKIQESSNEQVLSRTSSSSSKLNQVKTYKQVETSDTITDSVKEENLFQSQKDHSYKPLKTIRHLKKTKREMNLTETQEILEKNKVLHQKRKGISNGYFHANTAEVDNLKKNLKNIEHEVSKYQLDILLSPSKRNMNYSERHRLKNGYNLLHLGQGNKKVKSDLNKSNIGDLVQELPKLPDLTNICRNNTDENEEMFYQELTEKKINLKEKNQLSFRSDGPLEVKKFNGLNGQKQIFGRKDGKNFGLKQISKSFFIDLRPVEPAVSASKKSSHYCATESSATTSKVELALKAKTYGYLVNARNVFNLKAQAKKKFSAAERKVKAKMKDNTSASSREVSDLSPNRTKLSKQKPLPVKDLSTVLEKLPCTLEESPKAKNSLDKARFSKVSEPNKKRLFLPKVNNSGTKGNKIRREALCLKSSNEVISPL